MTTYNVTPHDPTLYYIPTDKGRYVFLVWKIDSEIIPGDRVIMSQSMQMNTIPITLFAADNIVTQFTSTDGRFYIDDSNVLRLRRADTQSFIATLALILGTDTGSMVQNYTFETPMGLWYTNVLGRTGVSLEGTPTYPVELVKNTADLFGIFGTTRPVTFDFTITSTMAEIGEYFKEYGEPPTPPEPEDTDPYANIDGEGALPGGADVDLPAEPTLSALDAGMFALFAPSSSQMKALASYLWTDFGGAGTDVVQMLGEVVEALKRTVANPLDLVLGLSIIASQGLSKGGSSNVHVGFWDTGVSMTKLAKQYFTVDCGSITFNPVCGDTFLDYAPYSKFSIFLPYVGTKTLDANDVVGHTISVKYRGDCVTGGLVCYLKRDGTIIAEFAGNCALNLPLSADSWGQTISGGLSVVAGAVGGAVTGGAAGAAAGAVTSAASVATNPSVLAPQVEYTGAVAGGSGHMGSQKPFILREAVRFHSTSHFNTVTGYPSFYYRKLGDCTGFTQVVDVHMDGLSATGAELTEIESLLKGGVIL